jgi:hypothetical protein
MQGESDVNKSKTGKSRDRKPRARWWSSGNHPRYATVTLVTAVLGVALGALSFVYTAYGPFNLFPKGEPPVTAQEQAYATLARGAMKDGTNLLDLSSEPPHFRDKFHDPEYIKLRHRIADELQKIRESEPSERLRPIHQDVILFLEKAQDTAQLMSRYSYSLDMDTFNRAAEASSEATLARDRVTAELNQIANRLKPDAKAG